MNQSFLVLITKNNFMFVENMLAASERHNVAASLVILYGGKKLIKKIGICLFFNIENEHDKLKKNFLQSICLSFISSLKIFKYFFLGLKL